MNRSLRKPFASSLSITLILGSAVVIGIGGSSDVTLVTAQKSAKVMREFHGVKLGMKSEQVQAAVGKPETKSETSEEYKLTGDDTLTVHYDGGVVKAMLLYFVDAKNAPPWNEVVGNAEVKVNDNGAKVARVEVSEEKFWVSMYQNKSGTMTTITISR
ncbi:MAG TPA: hypothetical protein VFD58_29395 [Blastocatellia bacterium]|nr:hypothetical protein [Blastocatellia bacterium]